MSYQRALFFLAAVTCAAPLAGCRGSATSDTIDTRFIAATIEATDDGNGTVLVSVQLDSRDPEDSRPLRLVGDDALEATFGKQSAVLSGESGGYYQAAFPEGTTSDVFVALNRSKYDSATESAGSLPESVELQGFGGATISRNADSIDLQLPDTVGSKSVDITGPCITTRHYDLGQQASDLYIDPGDIYSNDPYAECYVDMTVTSTLLGEADPKLHPSSSFVLSRSRTTSFYSIP